MPAKLITVDELQWQQVNRDINRINSIVDNSDEEEWTSLDTRISKMFENPIFDKYRIRATQTDCSKLKSIFDYLNDKKQKKQTQDQINHDKLQGYSSEPLTQDEYNSLLTNPLNETDKLPLLSKVYEQDTDAPRT